MFVCEAGAADVKLADHGLMTRPDPFIGVKLDDAAAAERRRRRKRKKKEDFLKWENNFFFVISDNGLAALSNFQPLLRC